MIFESEKEKEAFDFMYDIASEETSRRGCNDLPKEFVDKFKNRTVPTSDCGEIVQREIIYDFDICHWLKLQCKDSKEVKE